MKNNILNAMLKCKLISYYFFNKLWPQIIILRPQVNILKPQTKYLVTMNYYVMAMNYVIVSHM